MYFADHIILPYIYIEFTLLNIHILIQIGSNPDWMEICLTHVSVPRANSLIRTLALMTLRLLLNYHRLCLMNLNRFIFALLRINNIYNKYTANTHSETYVPILSLIHKTNVSL